MIRWSELKIKTKCFIIYLSIPKKKWKFIEIRSDGSYIEMVSQNYYNQFRRE